MQFERLRAKADFQDWRGQSAMKVAIAPILDLMSLSGYGLLLADVHGNSELSKSIVDVWNKYLDGPSGEPIVRGLKISDRFDAGIDLEYAEQYAQVRSISLDNKGLVWQGWHE